MGPTIREFDASHRTFGGQTNKTVHDEASRRITMMQIHQGLVRRACRSLPLRCVMWSHSCSASSDMKFATTAVSAAGASSAPPVEDAAGPPPPRGAALPSAAQESRSICWTREMMDTNWSWKLGRSSCASACTCHKTNKSDFVRVAGSRASPQRVMRLVDQCM